LLLDIYENNHFGYFFKKSTDNEYVNECINYGTIVPNHFFACWNCGQVLSENIRKLAKNEQALNYYDFYDHKLEIA
jgi:hypothetical protein